MAKSIKLSGVLAEVKSVIAFIAESEQALSVFLQAAELSSTGGSGAESALAEWEGMIVAEGEEKPPKPIVPSALFAAIVKAAETYNATQLSDAEALRLSEVEGELAKGEKAAAETLAAAELTQAEVGSAKLAEVLKGGKPLDVMALSTTLAADLATIQAAVHAEAASVKAGREMERYNLVNVKREKAVGAFGAEVGYTESKTRIAGSRPFAGIFYCTYGETKFDGRVSLYSPDHGANRWITQAEDGKGWTELGTIALTAPTHIQRVQARLVKDVSWPEDPKKAFESAKADYKAGKAALVKADSYDVGGTSHVYRLAVESSTAKNVRPLFPFFGKHGTPDRLTDYVAELTKTAKVNAEA